MNIKKKLTIAMLVTSSLPLIVFAIISLYLSLNTATKNAMTENLKSTEIVEEKINGLIDKNLYGLKTISRNPVIRSYDVNKSKPILSESIKVYKDFSSITVSKADGIQIVKNDDGKLSSIADRDFFQKAINGEEEVVSQVLASQATGQLITVLATPIREFSEGKVTGIIQGAMDLDMLNGFVKELSKNNVTVYILDKEGKLLAHPTKKSDKIDERLDMKSYEFVRSGLAGSSGSVVFHRDGQKMLVSYVQNRKTGWLICAEIPNSIAIEKSIRDSINTFLVGLTMLFITCGIIFVLAGRAARPIKLILSFANRISEGDLTVNNINIKSKDEIGELGRAFERMITSLQEVIGNIKEHSLRVSESSREMIQVCDQQAAVATGTAENANEIAERILLVDSSVDKISFSMNNLDCAVNNIDKKLNIVFLAVSDALNHSEKGSNALAKLNLSMKSIQQSVNDTAKVMNKLEQRSEAIGRVTEVIKGISEQTNLLALNAAIEAARAGEYGRGFAVVAEEVRKLAEQSGEAAEQVNNIINGVQKETENVIMVTDKGIAEVDEGSKVINEANSCFELIFKSIQEVSIDMKKVSDSIDNMNNNGKEVFINLNSLVEFSKKVADETQSISSATEEQVASIEEMTASVYNFSEMTDNLERLTNKFKTS